MPLPRSGRRIDLHVHTRRYSGCAEFLDPEQLGAVMAERHLAAVLLTEHDHWWGRDELDALRQRCAPRRVFSGVELTARDGHVIAIGVESALSIDVERSVAETTRLVAGLRGFSILAHPRLSHSDHGRSPPPGLGAVEVASTVTSGEHINYARILARKWGLPMVAGSDAHAIDRVGYCSTRLPYLPRDERELCAMLRAGLGEPEFSDDTLSSAE